MSVKVKLPPILKHLAEGQEVIEATGRTTGECLEELERRFPDIKKMIRDTQGQLRSYCQILVNSKSVYPDFLTAPVKDGDQIDIVVLVTGG
jgi:molybdopterin converting factor small subunit